MNPKTRKFRCVLACALLSCTLVVAQEAHNSVWIEFRSGSSVIEPEFRDNAAALAELDSLLTGIKADSTLTIKRLDFFGTASPEGTDIQNSQLAGKRMLVLEEYIGTSVPYRDSCVTRTNAHIPWEILRTAIGRSRVSYKEEALRIIDEIPEDEYDGDRQSRVRRLMEIEGGKYWKDMQDRFFGSMRYAGVAIETERIRISPPPPPRKA